MLFPEVTWLIASEPGGNDGGEADGCWCFYCRFVFRPSSVGTYKESDITAYTYSVRLKTIKVETNFPKMVHLYENCMIAEELEAKKCFAHFFITNNGFVAR